MGPKVILILLVVIGVLFFFMLSSGAKQNNSQPLPDDKRSDFAENNPPPDWISGMIGRFSPKLELPNPVIHFGGPLPLSLDMPPGKKEFRQAKFAIEGCNSASGCPNVAIAYRSKNDEGKDLRLDSQPWQPTKKHPHEAGFIILKSGGTLTLSCLPACTATLQ